MKISILISGLVGALLVGFLIYDGIVKNESFEKNTELVKTLRSNGSKHAERFMVVISGLVMTEFVLAVQILVFLLSRDKFQVLCAISGNALAVYILALLKLLYAEPRPFFIYPEINIIGKCEGGFGHPSGHALVGLSAAIITTEVVFHDISLRMNSEKSIEYTNVEANIKVNNDVEDPDKEIQDPLFKLKIFAYTLAFSLVFLIGLSRVYLGVHSYQQVLSGWAYGTLYLIFYFTFLKEVIEKTLRDIGHTKTIYSMNLYFTFVTITLITIAFFTIALIVFFVTKDESKRNLYSALIKANCGETKFKIADIDALIGCGLIGFPLGLYFGAFFSKGLAYTPKDLSYNFGFGRRRLRFLVPIVILAISIGINLGFETTKNEILLFIFGSFLSFMFAGINFTYTMPIVYDALKISYSGDFMRLQ